MRAPRQKLPNLGAPPEQFLGASGSSGVTAYFGLLDAAAPRQGDVVFVSAAAGAVGSAVCQIAKAKGMTVIGSAGGAEKCAFVRSIGVDHVIDYKAGPILTASGRRGAGRHRRLFRQCRRRPSRCRARARAQAIARFAICGMISIYNATEPTSFRLIQRIIAARIRLEGFIVFDYFPRMAEFYAEMGPWLADGTVKSRETVVDGLDNTADAFLGLFKGENTGKMLVRL